MDLPKELAYKSQKELLLRYFAYARTFNPVINDSIKEDIIREYETMVGARDNENNYYSPRLLENFSRLILANCRLRLSHEIDYCDIQSSKDLMMSAFSSMNLIKEFMGVHIVDMSDYSATPSRKKLSKQESVLALVGSLSKGGLAHIDDILEACRFSDCEKLIEQLCREGQIFSPKTNHYKLL